MLDRLTLQDFSGRVGDAVAVTLDDGRVIVLRLSAAEAAGGRAPHGTRDPFSLQFHGPKDAYLEQRIYRLDFGDLGAFDLFLVPVGLDPAGYRYEAIFG